MPGVSKEQIARAKEINILDYILRHEPDSFKQTGNRYVMKGHESFVVSNGKWKWNSRGFGAKQATALNYLIKYHGYSFVDAVRELAGDDPAIQPDKASSNQSTSSPVHIKNHIPNHKPFGLPPRNRNNDRAISYLLSRGIDRESIDACISAGTLYESVKTHNCVFTGRNEEGKTRYACFRGTSSQFKRDVDGSDKRHCFLLPPFIKENNDKVICFEAPIDALSHQTLLKSGIVYIDGWRLTLGGDSLVALEHFLISNPQVNTIYACLDNDAAGETAAAKIMALPDEDNRFSHVSVIFEPPPIGKDWNDTLIELKRQERRKHINRTDKTEQSRGGI